MFFPGVEAVSFSDCSELPAWISADIDIGGALFGALHPAG